MKTTKHMVDAFYKQIIIQNAFCIYIYMYMYIYIYIYIYILNNFNVFSKQ